MVSDQTSNFRASVPPPDPKPLNVLYGSLLATMVLAATMVAATFWLSDRMQDEDDWVRHTLEVRNQVAQVLVLVQRAESSQRGYLLTGHDNYLAPYETALTALPVAIDEAAKLVGDNAEQQQAVSRLQELITVKLGELRSTIEERRAGHLEAALSIVNSNAGQRTMDEIRRIVSALETEENRLLMQRQAGSVTFELLLQAGTAAAFLLICVVGLLVIVVTRRSFAALTAARDALASTNRELVEQMSQREHAESQLRQAQKMKAVGELTGGIAHDFNNMLGVIGGSLELMQRRIKRGDFGIERYAEAANKAVERAAALTHRLLAFARQQPLAPAAIDANRMITTMSDLLRSTLGEHIRIETVLAAGLWTAHADTNQLENVILNIAINARDAMSESGRLTIETANAYLDDAYCRQNAEVEPGQFVMIAISDTGKGMTPDVAARAFDPFFTTKPAGSGTGLGMSQVYGFVKQSKGHVKIYSEPGAGTTVKIYLPRLVGSAEEIVPTPPQVVRTGKPNEAILVVEDDALMRRLSTDALRELGYTVFDCESAAEALAILDREADIKLLFTDVVMPESNGKKLAEEAVRRRPALKVLFTTGYTPNAVVHSGVLDAGVHLLSKPFTIEQLAARVRSLLDA
jgi:signal transduction histidine kinase